MGERAIIPFNPNTVKNFVQNFAIVTAGYAIVIYFKTSTKGKMTFFTLHFKLP